MVNGRVPNITQYKLKNWGEADIAKTLKSGMTADADRVGGNMVEVVRNTDATDRRRPHGDRGLYEVAAGGRRALRRK